MPSTVVDSVRDHIETTASHLIDPHTEPLLRYQRVTRVHVMCILRGTSNGKYSKWYRESHYLHHVITQQPPPDLTDTENILVVMFGMGMFPTPNPFFWTGCAACVV